MNEVAATLEAGLCPYTHTVAQMLLGFLKEVFQATVVSSITVIPGLPVPIS